MKGLVRKTLFATLALALLHSSAHADYPKTAFRKLTCDAYVMDSSLISVQAGQASVEIPEDAFNYTAGMQTFWIPLKVNFFDQDNKTAYEVKVTNALDKIGSKSELSYIMVRLTNINTGTEVEGSAYNMPNDFVKAGPPYSATNTAQYSMKYGAKRLEVKCTLKISESR
jgi:hypothetical protein